MYDYEEFYKKNPVDIHDDPERFIKIASLIKGRVIDIGCGTGTLTDYFQGEYSGYDISREAIAQAREVRRKNALFLAGDFTKFENFDFTDYDTIVLTEFLEHIEDDSNIFKNIEKSAPYGARLIISVPNGDRIPCDEHVRTFTIPELRARFKQYGRVKFYNWSGAKSRILMTVDLKEKNNNEVSLVIIAKNEDKGIEDCILSALEVADHIIVKVDDKTTDHTYKIAKQYADEISFFTWQDDFSKARNDAQAGVTTPWILSLDAHEYIVKFDNLEERLKTEADALLVELKLESGFTFHFPRLYRRHCQYKDAVHNNLITEKGENYPEFLIQHNREKGQSAESTKEREEQKAEMMPRILKQQLALDESNTRASFHLGVYYHSKNKPKEAIKYYRLYCRYSKVAAEKWYILFSWSQCLLGQKKYLRAYLKAREADRVLAGRWETEKLIGVILHQSNRNQQAFKHLVKSFDLDNRRHLYQPWPRNDADTYNLIGEICFKLKKYKEAGLSFERAAELATDKIAAKFYASRHLLLKKIVNSP